jgi:hypothetical protein
MTREEAIAIFRGFKFLPREMEAADMAIKALEQEPCEDCISRQAVINAIANTCFWLSADNWKELTKCINSISPVTPQQTRWIPVSERLPEIHQDMLLSLRSLDVEVGFRAETEPYFYCHSADGCYVEPQNVLAWRPLPKPYKTESEE